MTRREDIELMLSCMPVDSALVAIKAELRALWAVKDEYAQAIEALGGTLPPALDAYEEGQ